MHRKSAAFYQTFLIAALIGFILLVAKLPAAVECAGGEANRFSILTENDEEDATKIESLPTELEMQVEELKEIVNLKNENIAESSKQKQQQQQQKGILNLPDGIKEYKINMDKLITVAVKHYESPPTDVQMEKTEKEAKRKLKSHIFKTYLLQNVSMEVKWPQWAKDNLYRNIQRILEEIKNGKYREYEQKKFNLIDENQLRRLFDFVQRKFKSANKIQMQKKMFGLYLAMNNLSSPNDNQKGEHKFVYKLTKAQRYHLSGYIQKIFYNHFDLHKDNTVYTSRWQNARKKSKRIAAIKAPSKDSNVDKIKLHNMIDHLILNPTKRMIRTWHKFSTLFEIAFGLYVKQMDGETAAMSKQQIQDLDLAILDIMFDGTDFIDEKKLRKFILNKFVKEEMFYQKVKAGDLEKPLRKILKEYNEIDWKKMPIDNLKWKMDEVSYRKKLNLWLESLIYEILYEMVDPELNLEFGSDIVKEARQAVNDSFGALELQPIDQQQQHHSVVPQQSWQWWYVAPSVPLVQPGFYVPDPSASAMTYYDYNMQHIIYSQIQAARNHLNEQRARSFMPVDPSISYASAARYGRRQSTVVIREIDDQDTNSPSHDHRPNMPLLSSGYIETDHSGRNHVEDMHMQQQKQTKDSSTATHPSWQNMRFGTIDYPTHSQMHSTDRDDGIDNSNEHGNQV